LLTSALASLFLVLYIPLLLMKVNISSKPFSFLGKISYEIYLVHMKVLVISYSLVHITKSYYLYVYIGIVIIIAYVFSKMLNFNMGCRLKRAPQPPLSGALPVTDSTMISS
jgi:membrane-bound acyltransferase YfiQ involved in biofilm formation